jgi:hypothetical protein
MFELIRDIGAFLWERKKWWLAPAILAILLVALLVIAGGSTALSPFVYSLF